MFYFELQAFKFDVRAETGKEMVALRDLRTRVTCSFVKSTPNKPPRNIS
jgi:hypothetical protein